MFAPRYFGSRYFPPRYFGVGGAAAVVGGYFGHYFFGARYFPPRYFSPPYTNPIPPTTDLPKSQPIINTYLGRMWNR